MGATSTFTRLANRLGKQTAPSLHIDQFRSKTEFDQFYSDYGSAIHQAFLDECSLCKDRQPFNVNGFCHVCGKPSTFQVDFAFAREISGHLVPAWRESTVCSRCHLSNRQRAAVHLAEDVAGLTEDEQLYMTEEISRLYKVMRRRHRKTQGSEYLADVVPRGSKNEKGIRNEDLTRLTFADDQFSVVMCFEVLEHVPNYRAALSELARVLQQGGRLVMSAPFNAHIQEHCVRAFVRADGSIEHMLEPEFHVDPLNPQGCLCFYHFGWALLDDLRSVGFSDAYVVRYASKELCYLGADPLMFMATKT